LLLIYFIFLIDVSKYNLPLCQYVPWLYTVKLLLVHIVFSVCTPKFPNPVAANMNECTVWVLCVLVLTIIAVYLPFFSM